MPCLKLKYILEKFTHSLEIKPEVFGLSDARYSVLRVLLLLNSEDVKRSVPADNSK